MPDIVAQIHQGRYDSERKLLNLKENAERLGKIDVLDAVHQRLKLVSPNIYQRLVGPLRDRIRDKRLDCYCNHQASLQKIYKDIMDDKVPHDALTCDACWQEDLTPTWGYYGYSSKMIPKKVWNSLCNRRANAKF